MNELEQAKHAIKALLTDKVVAYHVEYANIGDGATAGLFLSQLLYWYGKGSDVEGWIYKTQAEWTVETGLTRREQETARNRLKKKGIIEEKRDGMPARLFYRPNIEIIISLLSKSKKPSNPRQITAKHECTIPPIKDGGFRQSRMADSANQATPRKPTPAVAPTLAEAGPEITTETTTEISSNGVFSENSEVTEKQDDDDKKKKESFHKQPCRSKTLDLETLDSLSNYLLKVGDTLEKHGITEDNDVKKWHKVNIARLRKWFDDGIPVECVVDGIETTMSRHKTGKVNSVKFFENEVMKAYEVYQAGEKVKDDANKSVEQTSALLARLKKARN
jgi:hypothetical protein